MAEAVFSPESLEDVGEIHRYISLDDPDAADRVLLAFEQNASLLAGRPELGQLKARFRNLRLWVVTEFPSYLMFYRERAGEIEVVRVLHGARDLPGLFR